MIREGHKDVLSYRARFFAVCIEELADSYGVSEQEAEKLDPPVDDMENIKYLAGIKQ